MPSVARICFLKTKGDEDAEIGGEDVNVDGNEDAM